MWQPSYDYLEHHGVEGQKWGVRHGPPYPLEGGISKGTVLASVSTWKKAKDYTSLGRAMYTYNPDDDWDSSVYKGPFSHFKSSGLFGSQKHKKIYETKFEVVEDLKMPTKKERIDEFIALYKNKKAIVADDLENEQLSIRELNVHLENKDAANMNMKNLKTRKDYEKAYEVFNHALESAQEWRSTREYMDIMSTKYDAMVDDNNQGRYNSVHDPVIIFNVQKSLRTIGHVRVSDKEIEANRQAVNKKLVSEGKTMTY